MTVRQFDSLTVGAPVLDGQNGSLITVLDAILVGTGGFAYGTTPSLGWTKEFAGTNLAMYRQAVGAGAEGNLFRYRLKVNDAGPGAGTSKEARIRGYEVATGVSATDASDGSNLFPTVAVQAAGSFVRKSATADATARQWFALGDERTFYMWILTGDLASAYMCWGFGDIFSLKANDVGRCMIFGRGAENSATAASEHSDMIMIFGIDQTQHYLARDTQNNVGAVGFHRVGDMAARGSATEATLIGVLAYKNNADNLVHVSPIRIGNTIGGVHQRGRLRGWYHQHHASANFSDRDTGTGTQDLAGQNLLMLKGTPNSGVYCVSTNAWEEN